MKSYFGFATLCILALHCEFLNAEEIGEFYDNMQTLPFVALEGYISSSLIKELANHVIFCHMTILNTWRSLLIKS